MLLGRDMIPKISDVRLAQMMETGTTEAAMGTAGAAGLKNMGKMISYLRNRMSSVME